MFFFFFKKWGEGRGDKSQRKVGVETELKLALWWLNLEADTAPGSRDYKSREVAGYREGLGFPTSTCLTEDRQTWRQADKLGDSPGELVRMDTRLG